MPPWVVLADVQFEKGAVGEAEPAERARSDRCRWHVVLLAGPVLRGKPARLESRCVVCDGGVEIDGAARMPGRADQQTRPALARLHTAITAVTRPVRPGALSWGGLFSRGKKMEAQVTVADLLVLAPWVIFGAGLAVICYRLLRRCGASHGHQRDIR